MEKQIEMENKNRIYFNLFAILSTFARTLVEIFVSLYLFKNKFTINQIVLFYFIANSVAILLTYIYTWIGNKYKYTTVMIMGLISFSVMQMLLKNIVLSNLYIIKIAIIYSLYRRGYWISRRFYITNVIPKKNSTEKFSFVIITGQIASIVAGYIGALVLDFYGVQVLNIISSIILFISIIPLFFIKYDKIEGKINFRKSIKKYNKNNIIAFSLYEINNIITFLFPIFISIYVKNTYKMAGNINVISNLAIIILVFIYGKIIKKKDYFVLTTILLILIVFVKININIYLITVVIFIESIIKNMQNQSLNKIYFESRDDMNVMEYNFMYQIIESVARTIAVIPLLFISNIKLMIIFINIVIFILLGIYIINEIKENI